MWQSNQRISSEKNSQQICKLKVGGPALKIRIKFYIDVFDTVRINVELQSLWVQKKVDSIQNEDKLFCEKKNIAQILTEFEGLTQAQKIGGLQFHLLEVGT